jgi:hypothetical protein
LDIGIHEYTARKLVEAKEYRFAIPEIGGEGPILIIFVYEEKEPRSGRNQWLAYHDRLQKMHTTDTKVKDILGLS